MCSFELRNSMRKAFTLIELLVVIAIVTVLAGILFPVFARARNNARRTQCMSNLRQIGAAIGAYQADWDGRYPYAWRSNEGGRHPDLRDVLNTYVMNDDIWRCPKDIGEIFPSDPGGFMTRTSPFYEIFGMSYGWAGRGWGSRSEVGGKGNYRITRPSVAPLVFEVRPWHGPYAPTDLFLTTRGTCSVLYCDHHVGWRTPYEFIFKDMPESVR